MIVSELCFTDEDMVLFASGSGDHSPLHLDPAFARRTAFGQPIVYGGLLSIAMLGMLPAQALTRVRTVRSSFPGPVLPGVPATARAESRPGRPDEWDVRLTARGKVLARVRTSEAIDPSVRGDGGAPRGLKGPRETGCAWTEIQAGYRSGPELDQLAHRFGVLSLDHRILEGIAWASSVVGMTIPDFDGLCAAVAIAVADEQRPDSSAARQSVSLRDYDERTDRMLIEGTLSDDEDRPRCSGLIECFPFSPTPLSEAARLTSTAELESVRGKVVLVGGSRGLGAALALALLDRGYEVHALYSSSTAAAAELRGLAGPYSARLVFHQVDAGDPGAVSVVADQIGGGLVGLALCAAPPPLPMVLTPESAGMLACYVADSISLAAVPLGSFLPSLRREEGWVLFCSAPAVSDPHRELPQLSTAKAGLEGLAKWVARAHPSARVLIARPPKMRTDMANTPNARAAAIPPEEVAASIVRRVVEGELTPGVSVLAPELMGAETR